MSEYSDVLHLDCYAPRGVHCRRARADHKHLSPFKYLDGRLGDPFALADKERMALGHRRLGGKRAHGATISAIEQTLFGHLVQIAPDCLCRDV